MLHMSDQSWTSNSWGSAAKIVPCVDRPSNQVEAFFQWWFMQSNSTKPTKKLMQTS